MARPSTTHAPHGTRSPVRLDPSDVGYSRVLHDADSKLQELEAQRVLERVRDHAKAGKPRAWGAPPATDAAVTRSLSRPLLSATNVMAKEAREMHKKEVAGVGGYGAGTMLAPGGGGDMDVGAPAAAGGRPSTASGRPSSAGLAPPTSSHGARARGTAAATSSGGSGGGVAPLVSSAAQIARLEAEVNHLRETIGVLLESGGGSGKGGSKRPGSARTATAAAGTRRGGAAGAAAAPAADDAVTAAAAGGDDGTAAAVHSAGASANASVVDERLAAEERIQALVEEKRRVAARTATLETAISRTLAQAGAGGGGGGGGSPRSPRQPVHVRSPTAGGGGGGGGLRSASKGTSGGGGVPPSPLAAHQQQKRASIAPGTATSTSLASLAIGLTVATGTAASPGVPAASRLQPSPVAASTDAWAARRRGEYLGTTTGTGEGEGASASGAASPSGSPRARRRSAALAGVVSGGVGRPTSARGRLEWSIGAEGGPAVGELGVAAAMAANGPSAPLASFRDTTTAGASSAASATAVAAAAAAEIGRSSSATSAAAARLATMGTSRLPLASGSGGRRPSSARSGAAGAASAAADAVDASDSKLHDDADDDNRGGGDDGGAPTPSRPASASGGRSRTPQVTRPAEFSFMTRPHSAGASLRASGGGAGDYTGSGPMSIAARRLEEERKQREAEEEAVLRYKFVAQPIPPSTRMPLFNALMASQEAKRRMAHSHRFTELQRTLKPFSQLNEHEEAMKARAAAARARLELAVTKELTEARKFRALPVPNTTRNPDGSYQKLVAREKDRPQRVASAARALAATASLPPRMALAEETEKRRRAEREARARAQETASKRVSRFKANGMPDFAQAHGEFEQSLREGRKSFAPTVTTGFGFDSADRTAADAARKAARAREMQLQTSRSMELRARSASASAGGGGLGSGGRPLSASARLGVTGGGAGDLLNASMRSSSASAFGGMTMGAGGGGGGGSATPMRRPSTAAASVPGSPAAFGGARTAASLSERLAASQAPPAAMTRTVQLRMLEMQRQARERQEQERREALAEEERQRRVEEATRAVAPLVQALEAERNPIPLAWHTASMTNAASLAAKEFSRRARENAELQRDRIRAAEAARPMLFMRSTVETRREEAKRSAMVGAAKAIGTPVGASWREVAASRGASSSRRTSNASGGAGGGGGSGSASALGEVFDDDERAFLGVATSRSVGGDSHHGGGDDDHEHVEGDGAGAAAAAAGAGYE